MSDKVTRSPIESTGVRAVFLSLSLWKRVGVRAVELL
jgi:hypothetical protein